VALRRHLATRGILINASGDTIRLVTHLDCSAAQIDQFVAEVKEFLS